MAQENAADVQDEEDDKESSEQLSHMDDDLGKPVDAGDLGDPAPEPDDNELSERVQRRINKEVGKRKELAERVEAANQRAEQIAQQNAELRRRMRELEKRNLKDSDTEAQARLARAIEDGNEDDQRTAIDEIADVRGRMRDLEREEEDPPPKPAARQQAGEQDTMHPAARRFLDSNRGWWDDNAAARSYALEVERELRQSEGMAIGDDLYKALDKRLRKDLPHLYKGADPGDQEDDDDDDPGQRQAAQRGQSPVAPADRGAGVRRPPSGGTNLTERDKVSMARYGLDPNNPKHRKHWLSARKGA